MTKPFIQGQGEDFDNESKLPIHLKMLLTICEAAEYSNIGINKIDSMLKQPNCPFVLYVGTRKLVKRKNLRHLYAKISLFDFLPVIAAANKN